MNISNYRMRITVKMGHLVDTNLQIVWDFSYTEDNRLSDKKILTKFGIDL